MHDKQAAIVLAGIPDKNNSLFHQIRFSAGDPAVYVKVPGNPPRSVLILRDIEMERARKHARVDQVHCPADFVPSTGLSGDRETATAQSLAEFLARQSIDRVIADRTMPLIFMHHLQQRSIQVTCDLDLGVSDRRAKDELEIAALQEAQQVTEEVMELACQLVARADCEKSGALRYDGAPLTSERVRETIDLFLTRKGYVNPASIVAGGPAGADCHQIGSGQLFTEQPVIIDIFPQNRLTKYHGDCTRTVVHGAVPERIREMHAAVVSAKQAAIQACRAGTTGEDVHRAATSVIQQAGFSLGLPSADAPASYCAMVHGTGHGIGLDVHEPPLLDKGGPPLVVGDAVTIEPGLYCAEIGGIRVEDMVIVQAQGCLNLNRLPEGLDWS